MIFGGNFRKSFTLFLYIACFDLIVLGFWNKFVAAVKITKLEVPKVIKHGSSVILDCEYEFDEKDQGLVIKWFFNDKHQPIYQWIPETAKRPQDSGVLKGKLNLDYKVNSDKMKMHRALHILRSSADLSGDYTCQVSTFEGEDKQTKKMLVFVPERKFHLKQQRLHDGNLKITCLAEGLYPKPEMSIIHSGKELENTEVFHKENNGLFDIIVTTVIMISDNNSTDEELSCDLKIPDANYTVRKEAVYYLSDNGSSRTRVTTLFVLLLTLCSLWMS